MPVPELTAHEMEQTIRRYYDGCNEADVAKMVSCFTPDAVHYFPQGLTRGPFRGAQEIAQRWRSVVQKAGARWTIDHMLIDPAKGEAVLEWSNFTANGLVRGTEWELFDRESRLIREIRAYVAAAPAAGATRSELGEFDYARRGYPLT
jgi:ketosteroid isomerase-like protein